eukprot:scaffold87093_cov25-Tisochrysis_lutea.AAC.2
MSRFEPGLVSTRSMRIMVCSASGKRTKLRSLISRSNMMMPFLMTVTTSERGTFCKEMVLCGQLPTRSDSGESRAVYVVSASSSAKS